MDYTVLIVSNDNDPAYGEIQTFLRRRKYEILVCRSGEEALRLVRKQKVNVILTDLALPGMDGLKMLQKIKTLKPHIEVIFISSDVSLNKVVEVMKEGAYDFYEKPVELRLLNQIIKKALEKQEIYIQKVELEKRLKEKFHFHEIIGRSKGMKRVLDVVGTVASKRSNVIIYGESGTGKELIARAIHNNSPRAAMPFIKVNCAALSVGVLESELFGHEKGAFTGAIAKRIGRFELAHGGTLFLDEVADIPLSTQVKLLRVLQEKEFERVGGNETIKVDVRIIAATNSDLKKAVDKKKFREDLYYRLNVVPLNVPPLRERKDDIPLLVSHFIEKYNQETEHNIKGIMKETMHILMNYHWPGNVRELENALESAMALSEKDVIEAKYLPSFLLLNPSTEDGFHFPFGMKLRDMEKEVIMATVNRLKGNKTKVAHALGVGLRTVQRKVQQYTHEK
jgi:DNA-binding NtrC family response regulator